MSSNSRAKTATSAFDEILKDKNSIQELYSLLRTLKGPTLGTRPILGTGASGVPQTDALRNPDVVFTGIISYTPRVLTMTSTSIDISRDQDPNVFTSRLVLANSGAFDLETILGAAHAGQYLEIQGVLTETILVKHGVGNIRTQTGADITITGNQVITLRFDSIANEWVVVTGASGGDNLGNHEATQDINFKTFDGINIDRLRFIGDSGAPVSADDPSIFSDILGESVIYNAKRDTSKGHFWKLGNITSMGFVEDVAGNRLLDVRTGDLNAVPIYQMLKTNPTPSLGQALGQIQWLGTRTGNASLVNYGAIAVEYENITVGSHSGQVRIEATENAIPITFMRYNENDSGEILAERNLDMILNDVKRIDRARFSQDSGGPVQIDDPSIFIDSASRFIFNNNGLDSWLWVLGSKGVVAVLDQDVGGNILFQLQQEVSDINSTPIFQFLRSHTTPTIGQSLGQAQWLGTRTGNSALVNYGAISVEYENVGVGTRSGSTRFEQFRAGSQLTWMHFNDLDNNLIQIFRNLDFQGNKIINTGTLTLPTSTGSILSTGEAWVMDDGIKAIFNPNATVAGINVGEHSADPTIPVNGDIMYNGTLENFRFRENGAWVELSAGGGEVFTWTNHHDADGFDLDNIQNIIHDLSTATTAINFANDELQEISISANTTFTATGYATGKTKVLKITTDATLRTFTFPAGWKFIGGLGKPSNQGASKTAILTMTCFSALEAGVVAAYAVEP